MKKSTVKTPTVSEGVKGLKPLLLSLAGVLIIFLLALPSAGAAENPTINPSPEAPPAMAQRWVNGFYMAIPEDWKPVMSREGVGFFTGAHPDVMDDPSLSDLPMAALLVGRDRPPRGGDYSAFIAEFEAMGKDESVHFTSSQEETFIGSHPAVFYTFSAEIAMGDKKRKIEGRMVVSKIPDPEGMHTLITLAGTESSMEKYKDVIKAILASAKEGPAPLDKTLSYSFGATQEAFRHSEGPFVAADGTVAVMDRFGKRIRLFDPAGSLVDEWGAEGKGEDGTFTWPTVVAFAPDGSLYVADEGYSVDANIQRFSRRGEFLGKIKADKKTLGDKGIYKPPFLAVTEQGKLVTMGVTEIGGGENKVLVFSPEGALLSSWKIESVKTMALLPGDKLVLTREGKENADTFHILDLEGKELKEWSYYGFGPSPTPGDGKVYFRPEYLDADGEGRIYAYDDAGYGIWIYDEDGRFLQVVPAGSTFDIVMGMAVLPGGDVIIKDRPRGYGPGEPSIHRMKNATPAALPKEEEAAPQIASPLSPSEDPKDLSAPTEGLEAELTRLKKALELREGAVVLEEKGDFAAAAVKYKESLEYYEDPAVAPYAEGLERRAVAATENLQPEKKEEEPKGSAIATPPGRPEEPAEKPKEAPSPAADPAKEARKKAEALWKEGAALQQGRKYDEALELFRQGLELSKDDTVSAHVAKLEAFIPKAKARAEALWNDAGKLQVGKKYDEALKKYKEGLNIYHNAVVVEHVKKLEAFIAKQKN